MSSAPSLTWLHVSDLHFGHGDAHYRFDQSGVTSAIVSGAQKTAERLGPPDVILVTGDVAFSGQPAQYAQAKQWLERLRVAVGGSPSLFMVPGNHDIDRKLAGKLTSGAVHRDLRADPKKLDELLQDPTELQAIWPKLRAYSEFAQDFGPALTAASPFYSQEIPSRLGGKLVVVGLNTALLCLDDSDSAKTLGLGRGQLLKAIELQPKDALLLVLQHHPPEWLHDGQHLSALLQQRAHIQFSGHVHQQQGVVHVPLLGGSRLQFVAGAGHKDRSEEGRHAYAWGKLTDEGLAYYSWVWQMDRQAFAPAQMLDSDDFKREDHAFVERARLPKSLQSWLPTPLHTSVVARPRSTKTAPKPAIEPKPVLPPTSPAAVSYSPDNVSYHIPFRAKSSRLVGRQRELEEVQRRLKDATNKHAGRVAIIGIGGLGKTQLAADYCHVHRTDYPGGIYWLDAGIELDGQLTALCDSARWLSPESKHEEKLAVAYHRLRSHDSCLLVFDNVEALESIQRYLPLADNKSRVLILSRTEQPGYQTIELELLTRSESMNLLELESQRALSDQQDCAAAAAIAAQLDGLPLALELVGAHMRRRPSIAWAEYAKGLKEQGLAARVLNWSSFVDESLTRHGADLYAALHLDKYFFRDKSLLLSVLDLLTWAAPTAMGESLLTDILEKPDALDVADALALSEQLCILSIEYDTSGQRRVRMHRLVQQIRQKDVPKPQGSELERQAARLEEWFAEQRADFAKLPAFEAELDHLRVYKEYAEQSGLWATVAQLLWLEAYPQNHRGQYQQANTFFRSALKLYEEHSLHDPLLHAHLLTDLGETYRNLGNYQEALRLALQALSLSKEVHGDEHPDTASALGNLGMTYRATGQPQEALKLEQQALAIFREVHGEYHSTTATALGNLGATYRALGQPQEALKLAQQALAVRREALPGDRLETATALNNLSVFHSDLGQLQEARNLAQQALVIHRELLGEKHPATATALGNLGSTCSMLGEHQEALKLEQQALDIRREVLGEEHPDTARALSNLGDTHRVMGQPQEAFKLAQQALVTLRKVLGDRHPDTTTALNNLGVLYSALGQPREALKLVQQVLDIRRDVLGAKHPATAASLNNLGAVYNDLEQPQEALKLAQQALTINREVLGDKHPATAQVLHNASSIYYALHDYGTALSHEKAALAIRLELFGNQHPDTIRSRRSVAIYWRALGQGIEALKVVRDGLRALPTNHPGYAQLQEVEAQLLDTGSSPFQPGWRQPPKPKKGRTR